MKFMKSSQSYFANMHSKNFVNPNEIITAYALRAIFENLVKERSIRTTAASLFIPTIFGATLMNNCRKMERCQKGHSCSEGRERGGGNAKWLQSVVVDTQRHRYSFRTLANGSQCRLHSVVVDTKRHRYSLHVVVNGSYWV